MSTPLTDSIQNLTDYINEITGEEDTNLSDAVATLANGVWRSDAIELTPITVHEVQGVSTFSVSISSALFDEYKTILIKPAIELSKNDWLYVEGFDYFNAYSSGIRFSRPSVYISKVSNEAYITQLVKESNISQVYKRTNVNSTLINAGCRYHSYTNDVLMTGTITVYGTDFDFNHFLEVVDNVLRNGISV